MQRNLNQIPESMGTQDTNKGKEGIHALKNSKYGNIFPFPPGSLQQWERDDHYKLLKQQRTYMGAGWRAVSQVPSHQSGDCGKTTCLTQHQN